MDSEAKDVADVLILVFTPFVALGVFMAAGPLAAITAALLTFMVMKSVSTMIANHDSDHRARIAEQRQMLAIARRQQRAQAEADTEQRVAELKSSPSASPARFPLAS